MKMCGFELKSQSTAIVLAAAVCFGAVAMVSCWNDDDEIIKWNPTWLSNFRYSKPIGIRNRGLFHKRLSDYDLKRLPPYFPPPPFELKRSVQDISRELQIPINRKKLLGWYSGPGSLYHLDSGEDAELADVDAVDERKK